MTISVLEQKLAIADRMIDVLVLAFSTDPTDRWLYPNAQQSNHEVLDAFLQRTVMPDLQSGTKL